MTNNFVNIEKLDEQIIYKLKSSIKDKVEQIKKRKRGRTGEAIYLLAINEGPITNGYRKWKKNVPERFQKVVDATMKSWSFDVLLYGSVFESEYCQTGR